METPHGPPPHGAPLLTGQCLTAVSAAGWAVGLDAGVTTIAAQVYDCYPAGTPNQTFALEPGAGAGGVESGFAVRSLAFDGHCLQPELERLPHFDAVAFEQPDGSVTMVVMNTNDHEMPLTIYDEQVCV